MHRVTVLGSANMDLVVRAPALPRPGETVLGYDFTTVPGGKGANQAVAVARAGAQCTFLGAIGTDAFGAALRAGLADAGVQLGLLREVDGPSGVALITVDDAGQNQITVAPGANATLLGLDHDERAAIRDAEVLLCQLEVPLPTVVKAVTGARAAGTTVVLNAAPAQPLFRDLLDNVDVLIINESEAAALGDAVNAVEKVVLTLGAAGAVYTDRQGGRLAVPAPTVTAVDTTAAGDAFAGAFAVALAEQRPVDEAVRWACAAGAVCATRPGAVPALPHREDIDELAGSQA
jgi:ribokinase